MAEPIDFVVLGSQFSSGNVQTWRAVRFSVSARNFSMPQASSRYFSRAFFAVGAVPVLEENAHHRRRGRNALFWRQQNSAIAGKILVTGDSAKLHAEVDLAGWGGLIRCRVGG